jgi:hypothetical protein
MKRAGVISALAAAVLLAAATAAVSYSTYAKWSRATATFYVNPANTDVSASAAATALQYALNVWSTQTGTTFRYQYGGTVSDTSTAYDNRNVIIFRNTTNGSALGTTYSWWDSSKNLLDSDIVFWTSNFAFFTGTSGCGVVSNAAYLEDVATHELGHALGLNHSSTSGATMYPSYSYCSQALRTLASDDIAGAKALYPASTATAPSNTAPVVTITSPANGASFVQGTNISFAGSASDTQDGNISSRIQWKDNGVAIGSGSLLSSILSLVGVHTITATVTDNNGATASSQVSITITLSSSTSSTTEGTLSARKVTNSTYTIWRSYLTWTGVQGTYVDVFRNGTKIKVTGNDGGYTDEAPVPGANAYKLCKTATTVCTNSVSVTF